jgi:hypothetical protein
LQVPDDQILANSWYEATDNVQDYKTLHTADLTVDGNPRSAWRQWWPSSGIDDSPGSGNYITWSFAQSYDIRLVCILNGWEGDSHTFDSAEPVKSATIGNIDALPAGWGVMPPGRVVNPSQVAAAGVGPAGT